jgi:GTP-sensing pleiotropic transcriptional regulator CodY
MKRRIIEREFPNGVKLFVIQKKGLFSWIDLNKNMTTFGVEYYKTFQDSKTAFDKSTGECKTTVIYESNN